MKTASGILLIVVMSAAMTCNAEEGLGFNAELSLTHDDNLNRNIIAIDEVKDTFATATIGAQTAVRLSAFDYISYNARFKHEHYNKSAGLNNAEVGVGIKYNIKPVPGFTQPVYIFSADIALIDSSTDIRDTTAFNTGLTVSAWITNKLSARGGVSYRIKDSDSRVFDNKDLRLFINGDLLFTEHLTAYATINYINGQAVSTVDVSASSPEILSIINLADQIEFDPTFEANQLAYRIDAKTRVMTLGMNYAIAQNHSLDFSVRNVHSRAGGKIDYAITQFSLSYLVSF